MTGRNQKTPAPLTVSSEGPLRITEAVITAAWRRRAAGTRLIRRDNVCRGLCLIVNATSMSWSYSYRPHGKTAEGGRWPNRTIKLGEPASMSPDEARRVASRMKGEVAESRDPAVERKREQLERQRQRANTLTLLLAEYRPFLRKRPKLRGVGTLSPAHEAEEFNALAKAIAEMGAAELPPEALTTAMILEMLGAYGAHPSAAKHRFGALSRFLDWLVDRERLALNPCTRISRAHRPKAPQPRSRYLRPDVLARLWHAAEAMPPVHRDLARLLIAIPCRRGEAASLDWRHLDLDGAVWNQPGQLTKNSQPHAFHLHALPLDLLRTRHAAAGCPRVGLVFPGPRSGKKLATWPAMQRALSKSAGFSAWSWHDFRRSFATALGGEKVTEGMAKVSEVVADAILNHRQSSSRAGVLGGYQRADLWDEQRAAMIRWGGILAAAIDGTPPGGAEVIPLRRVS